MEKDTVKIINISDENRKDETELPRALWMTGEEARSNQLSC